MPRPSRGRGRGRGGRGGIRGRGRGRSAGRGGSRSAPVTPVNLEKVEAPEENLTVESDLQKYFVGTASFDQHHDAQECNKIRYVAGMTVLDRNGVEISQNARVRALAAAWSRKDHGLANTFLSNKTQFGLVEVLKALTLLDSSRCIRVEEKKLKRLQMQTGGKIKPKVLGKFKSNIDNLTAVKPKCGSASGAVCKHLRHWVKNIGAEELEFYALHYPAEPWKKLADICHFNPKKDFNLPWFLPFCFGEPAPEGSMVHHCKNVTSDNVNDLIKEFDIPYTHLKQFKDNLIEDSKAKIAATDLIDKVIWAYEDLQCDKVDEVLHSRFTNGEQLDLPYGKLMERLLTIKIIREEIKPKPYWNTSSKLDRVENPVKASFYPLLLPVAEKRLKEISLPLEAPIVVIGDKSSSMDVAIRTSTIIASLLTAITSAKLVFFNNLNEEAKFIPTNIEEVLEMAVTTQANGSTAPAASLYPFYKKKEVVKTFIMVTDEEENTAYKGYKFLQLYKMYREEVYPSKLVFVSFLRSQHAAGQMVSQLERSDVPVMQFKFDQSRPDLTKLDTLFGLLSSESDSFEKQVTEVEMDINTYGMQKVFEGLNLEDRKKQNDQETGKGKPVEEKKSTSDTSFHNNAESVMQQDINKGEDTVHTQEIKQHLTEQSQDGASNTEPAEFPTSKIIAEMERGENQN